MPQIGIVVEADRAFNEVGGTGLDLVVDLREVFADDAQADHDEAPDDQQRNDRGREAGYGATLKPGDKGIGADYDAERQGQYPQDGYDLQRRTVAIEFVQEQSIANKKRLEASDPDVRQRNLDELRATTADPERARQFLLRTSMIASQRRAEAITVPSE